jgi:hypothetical protein
MKCRCSIAFAMVLIATVVSSLRAGPQDPVAPTLRELARQNGGTYTQAVWTQGPLGRWFQNRSDVRQSAFQCGLTSLTMVDRSGGVAAMEP